MEPKDLKKITLLISIALFAISLTLPAYYIDRTDYDAWANSFFLLIFGWVGILGGGAAFAWLANPFILLSWILFRRKTKIAAILSGLAFFFAALFLCFHTIISSEETAYSVITARKAGYWLWLTSITYFFISAVIIYYREKNIDEEMN